MAFKWLTGIISLQNIGWRCFFLNALPKNCGNHPIWLAHMFQMGWFNHQLLLVFVHHQFRFVSPLFVGVYSIPSFAPLIIKYFFRMFLRKRPICFFRPPVFLGNTFLHPSVAMWLGSWKRVSRSVQRIVEDGDGRHCMGLQGGPPNWASFEGRVGQDGVSPLGSDMYIYIYIYYDI